MSKKTRGRATTTPPDQPSRKQVLQHPQLRKGGIHQSTHKATRSADKVALKQKWPQVSSTSSLPVAIFLVLPQ